MDKEKSGLREEDNIEKDGLQEENSDNDVYDGLDDFVEYDDLASLEGLPQLDELDGMDDLSALPEVAASIKMDDSELNEAGNNDNVDMTIDIPLPDVGITEEDGVASELSDGKDIQTTFPQLEPEEDTSNETAISEEDAMSLHESDEISEGEKESGENIMSIPEGGEEPEEHYM